MSHSTRTKKALKSSTEDRISALPDEVLQHVLGFLPAVDMVHTSALARRWRYLWKSTRCLRIEYLHDLWVEGSDDFINKFINCLLLLREPSCTLDEVELHCTLQDYGEYIGIWIRHALSCHAQMLSLRISSEMHFNLDGPLVSRDLRRLELCDVELVVNFLDFSSCPALDYLKLTDCYLRSSRILSQSVKRLSIQNSWFATSVQKHLISVPNLISLQIISCWGKTPLIKSMLSLETAVIRLGGYNDSYYFDFSDDFSDERWEDNCHKGDARECCGTCAVCCGDGDHRDRCALLGGLSSATNLELVASSRSLIFRRDLRRCPTFSKLKTLLLSEWCVQVDLRGLVCMLEHAPVLENLTLTFRKQEKTTHTLEVEGNSSLMEKPSAISGYLKIIKVECEEIDGRVCKVLKFLSTLDMEIIIKRTNRWLDKYDSPSEVALSSYLYRIQFQEVTRNFGLSMDLPMTNSGMQG